MLSRKTFFVVALLAVLSMAVTDPRVHDLLSLVLSLNGQPAAATEGTSSGGATATLTGLPAGGCIDIYCTGNDAAVLPGGTVTASTGAYVPANNYPAYSMCLGSGTTSFSFIPFSGTATTKCRWQARR